MAEIIGKNIIKIERVDSTNNYAIGKLKKMAWKEGTIIYAREQFAGRGQIDNTWESAPGCNLQLSIIFYPEFLPVQYQFLLSKVVALGVSDVVAFYAGSVHIKWPNDIYAGDRKIAGILIENSIMGSILGSSVAGIGLNVNQKEFYSNAPNPVSLFQILGVELDLEQVLTILAEAIDKWYLLLVKGKTEIIDASYLERLYRMGEPAQFRDRTGEYTGIIAGVNEIGQLEIKDRQDNIRTYHFKEVAFL